MSNRVLVGIKPDTKVLLDGMLHTAGEARGDGRIYKDFKTGDERFLTGAQQRQMAAEFRLVLGELPDDFVEHIARARAASFKVFGFADRTVALRRLRYIRAVHELPEKHRHRKIHIEGVISTIFDAIKAEEISPPLVPDPPDHEEPPTIAQAIRDKLIRYIASDTEADAVVLPPDPDRPTARTVRRLYRLYYASGQDIRVLLPMHCEKGYRGPRYDGWINKTIEKVIEESVLCPTPMTYADTLKLACDAVEKNAAGRALPTISEQRGGGRVLGKNLISRLVGRIDQYKMTNRQLGFPEAMREFSTVELGPQGRYANQFWEVDHTQLDIFVIDPLSEKAYARPWLTAILDRYSRSIVGFSITFAPPSWVSVMDAMRIAVFPKQKLIERLNRGARGIVNEWKCEGVPDFLITDHGREFKSRSMDETLAIMSVKSFQTKRRQPWLKGKIERWFGTLEDFLHSIPGTTFSKFYKREFYKSEKFAVLTIEQLNWVIAKWVIDVYHHDKHSKLPYPPAEMWSRSVSTQHAVRPAPKLDDFEALMGVVVNRCLRRGGVKYLGLRWDSEAFANLRGRLPHDADVPVRIDPRDLNKAYVWDERNEKWLTGHLKEPMEAAAYSLDQWFFIDFNRKENQKLHGMSPQAAIAKAIADIRAFIDGIREGYQSSKAYSKYLEFTSKGRSAWEAISQPAFDPNEDGPMKPHKPGETDVRAERAETGPYRDDNPPPRPAEDKPVQDRQESDDDHQDEEKSEGLTEAAPQRSTKPKRAAKPKPSPKSQLAAPSDEPTRTNADDVEFKDDDFSGPFTVRSQSNNEDKGDDQ